MIGFVKIEGRSLPPQPSMPDYCVTIVFVRESLSLVARAMAEDERWSICPI